MKVVVDTGPIIQQQIPRFAFSNDTEYYTVPLVIKECADPKTVEYVSQLGIKVMNPSIEAIQAVKSFATKTGDLSVLSLADIHVLALTWMLDVMENGGSSHLRSEPMTIVVHSGEGKRKEEVEKKDENVGIEKEENIAAENDENITAENDESVLIESDENSATENEIQKIESLCMDDEEGWITPNRKKQSASPSFKVACLCMDYAMQNVMLQMNLKCISGNGTMIKHVKTYILRCYGCFTIMKQMDKQFCSNCGGATLTRTSCAVDEEGNVKIFLKKNFQYRMKGTKFAIPNPKGGREGCGLILREDQKEYYKAKKDVNAKQKKLGKMADVFDPDFAPMFYQSPKLREEMMKPLGVTIGYGRKNPNERRRRK